MQARKDRIALFPLAVIVALKWSADEPRRVEKATKFPGKNAERPRRKPQRRVEKVAFRPDRLKSSRQKQAANSDGIPEHGNPTSTRRSDRDISCPARSRPFRERRGSFVDSRAAFSRLG